MRNLRRAAGRGVISHAAFTMAEILLSLTIIGVVAAITLPSLTGNINERTWATQKKALYARMSQAFPLMDSINTYDDAQSFIASALNSVTKINNVCSQDHVDDCGIDINSMGTLNGNTLTPTPEALWKWSNLGVTVNTTGTRDITYSSANEANLVAAFETGNGESIVLFYNPSCISDQEISPTANTTEEWIPYVCANLVYDLNNSKGPNTVGKDIGFMTVFFPTDSVVVSPIPDVNTATGSSTTPEGGGTPTYTAAVCGTPDEYRLPNKYEAMSLSLNNKLMTGTATTPGAPEIVTSSKGASAAAGTVTYQVEGKGITPKAGTLTGTTRCVKR